MCNIIIDFMTVSIVQYKKRSHQFGKWKINRINLRKFQFITLIKKYTTIQIKWTIKKFPRPIECCENFTEMSWNIIFFYHSKFIKF